jgi:hypothetical protein
VQGIWNRLGGAEFAENSSDIQGLPVMPLPAMVAAA